MPYNMKTQPQPDGEPVGKLPPDSVTLTTKLFFFNYLTEKNLNPWSPKPQKAWAVERKLINLVTTVHTPEKKGKRVTY